MRVTSYFTNSAEMSARAEIWAYERSDRWYIRTTMRCDHVHHEKRKAIVLIQGEQVIQKLITCKTCEKYGTSIVKPIKIEDDE